MGPATARKRSLPCLPCSGRSAGNQHAVLVMKDGYPACHATWHRGRSPSCSEQRKAHRLQCELLRCTFEKILLSSPTFSASVVEVAVRLACHWSAFERGLFIGCLDLSSTRHTCAELFANADFSAWAWLCARRGPRNPERAGGEC